MAGQIDYLGITVNFRETAWSLGLWTEKVLLLSPWLRWQRWVCSSNSVVAPALCWLRCDSKLLLQLENSEQAGHVHFVQCQHEQSALLQERQLGCVTLCTTTSFDLGVNGCLGPKVNFTGARSERLANDRHDVTVGAWQSFHFRLEAKTLLDKSQRIGRRRQ